MQRLLLLSFTGSCLLLGAIACAHAPTPTPHDCMDVCMVRGRLDVSCYDSCTEKMP